MSDVSIRLAGVDYPMRASFRAYVDLERALDTGLAQIYQLHQAGMLRLDEKATIVAIGMNAAAPESARIEDVVERLYELGGSSAEVLLPIADYLIQLGWQSEAERKKKRRDWSALRRSNAASKTAAARSRRRAAASRPAPSRRTAATSTAS